MFGLPPVWDAAARALVLGSAALFWVIILARVVGLRTFAKTTPFDFVTTVAMGSLLAWAAMASKIEVFVQAIASMGVLMALQWILARIRVSSETFEQAIRNTPAVLLENGKFIDEAMRQHRMTREDVLQKLRGADVRELSSVRAVILEPTGEMSVITEAVGFDSDLIRRVRGVQSNDTA